jgi:NAD+ synthase (glutamine-hydrolysing)
VIVGYLRGNLGIITRGIEQAREVAADIVTFPELALCGYPPEDLLLKPRFLTDNRAGLAELVPRCKGITVLVGFADFVDAQVYNAAALIHDGGLSTAGIVPRRRGLSPGL